MSTKITRGGIPRMIQTYRPDRDLMIAILESRPYPTMNPIAVPSSRAKIAIVIVRKSPQRYSSFGKNNLSIKKVQSKDIYSETPFFCMLKLVTGAEPTAMSLRASGVL
jgi:hypothetical protein